MPAITFLSLAPEADDHLLTRLGKLLGVRRRITGTALASAARTATTQSADLDVGSARGVTFYVNITAIAGTGVRFNVLHKDPASGGWLTFGAILSPITTTGLKAISNGPGLAVPSNITTANGCSVIAIGLPDTIRIEVTHTDASSVTYSVGYVLWP